MKKLATLLAVALMMSMAVPTFAAIDFKGNVATQLELGQNAENEWEVTGNTGIDIKTEFRARGGQQVRGVVELGNWAVDTIDKDGNPTGPFAGGYGDIDTSKIGIKKIWLETDGPFWNGGPSVSTRIGDVTVKWNEFVGYLKDKQGITVQGMEVGPVNARAFYAFDGENHPMGLEANADLMGVDLGAMVMHRGDLGTELAANASAEVVPGVAVNGEAALDANQNYLYRVGATVETMPNLTLTAGYRSYNDFAPAYANIGNDKAEDDAYDTATGFTVGLETEQNGIGLAAEYDHATDTVTGKAETSIQGTDIWASTKLEKMEMTETKFGAKRAFPIAGMNITGEYEGKLVADADAEHVVKANTKLNMIPELQGLGVNAEVKLVGTDLAHWAAGAEYAAPNGLNLGAEYHSVDGPSVTAGLKASF